MKETFKKLMEEHNIDTTQVPERLVATDRKPDSRPPSAPGRRGPRRSVPLVAAPAEGDLGPVAVVVNRGSGSAGEVDLEGLVRVLPAKGRFPRLGALGAILLSPRRRSRWLRQTLREVSGEIGFRTRPGALRVLVPPQA